MTAAGVRAGTELLKDLRRGLQLTTALLTPWVLLFVAPFTVKGDHGYGCL